MPLTGGNAGGGPLEEIDFSTDAYWEIDFTKYADYFKFSVVLDDLRHTVSNAYLVAQLSHSVATFAAQSGYYMGHTQYSNGAEANFYSSGSNLTISNAQFAIGSDYGVSSELVIINPHSAGRTRGEFNSVSDLSTTTKGVSMGGITLNAAGATEAMRILFDTSASIISGKGRLYGEKG